MWDPKDLESKFKEIHENKYEYPNLENDFKTVATEISILCKFHNKIFYQRPFSHISGNGCPDCGRIRSNEGSKKGAIKGGEARRIKPNELESRFKDIHEDKYCYPNLKDNYVNNYTSIDIECKIHGIFQQKPLSHLQGSGCNKCGVIKRTKERTANYKDVFEKFNNIHNKIYKYPNLEQEYKGLAYKITIECQNHGLFRQRAGDHQNGKGCFKCKTSKGEIKITNHLQNLLINFKQQYKNETCKNQLPLLFDFAIMNDENNLVALIEFQGIQHYKPTRFFGQKSEDIMKLFEQTQKRDNIKKIWCTENNIRLLEISYENYDDIENIINDFLKTINMDGKNG